MCKTVTRELNNVKSTSLSGKYFSIPLQNLPYYPSIILPTKDILETNVNNDHDIMATFTSQKVDDSLQKLRVGRPKKINQVNPLKSENSILGFLQKGVNLANSNYKSRIIGILIKINYITNKYR